MAGYSWLNWFNCLAKDVCFKPAEVGEGQNYTSRWYFDAKEGRCRQFYYGGYGGNENNFIHEHLCLARCEQKQVTEQPPRRQPPPPQRPPPQRPAQEPERPVEQPAQQRPEQPSSGSFQTSDCFLNYDSGDCRDSTEARWYYNKDEGVCGRFAYGGCGGNANNFRSDEECEQKCGHVQNICALPPVYGRCRENTTRWYYDGRVQDCVEFAFSGCRGNKNNFYTSVECLNECQRQGRPDERTAAPIGDVINLILILTFDYFYLFSFSFLF